MIYFSLVCFIMLIGGACTSAMDDEEEKPLTCEELGADPDQPLFCNAKGDCMYENMSCKREMK